MTTAERIDGLLNARGMSRRQLAIAADIPPSSFQSAMARGRNMTIEMLLAIADTLKVSTDYLLGLSDEITPDQTTQSVCQYTGLSSATVEYLHHCPDTFTRSFYRKFFDDLIQNGDFHLVDVPKLIFNAAQAHVTAIKAGISEDPQCDTENKVVALSDGSHNYAISAATAERFFLRQAQDEIQQAIELTVDILQCEVIKALKAGAPIQSGDFQWIVTNENESK